MSKGKRSKRTPRQPTKKNFQELYQSTKATTTIKGLLVSLNSTPSTDGAEIGINSLRNTLGCIEAITGRSFPAKTSTEITEEEAALIQTMYLESRNSKEQFLRIIGPVVKADMERQDKPVEFPDLPPEYRNRGKKTSQVVSDFANKIRARVSVEVAQSVDAIFSNLHDVLAHVEELDERVLQPLENLERAKRFEAIARLTKFTESDQPTDASLIKTPLHEAIYTHLRTLRFAHHVAGHSNANVSADLNPSINPILSELHEFGRLLAPHLGTDEILVEEIHSIASLPEFCGRWKEPISNVLSAAIGTTVNPDEVPGLCTHAQALLNIDCYYVRGIHDLHLPTLTTSLVISALCAIRHERLANTSHRAYWHAQKTPGTKILNALIPDSDGSVTGETRTTSLYEIVLGDLIPHEINQVWYQRLWNVYHAITGRLDNHRTLVKFRIARLEKFAQIFRLNDIRLILENTHRLQFEGVGLASSLTWDRN